jgi:hypothetical protein
VLSLKKPLAIAAACIFSCGAANAQNMPVSTFLAKADALKAKGAMAMFSSDIGLLKNEVQAAGLAYRAERKASEARGNPPEICRPEKAGLDSDELIASFRTIPAALRAKTTVKQGMIALLRKKFPCPK